LGLPGRIFFLASLFLTKDSGQVFLKTRLGRGYGFL
jgi:hypothetical protein